MSTLPGDLLPASASAWNLPNHSATASLNLVSGVSESPAGPFRSASAFFAVAAADPDKAYAFMQALFANQPAEGSAGLTDEQIVDLAKQAGVSMTDDLEKAITSDRYQKYALAQSLPAGATGTPHLEVNGEAVAVTMDPAKDITAHLK